MSPWGGAVIFAALAAACAYEVGVRRLAAARGRRHTRWPLVRHACAWGAVVLLALAASPPVAAHVGRDPWAETCQFALVAFGAAPLAVLAWPWTPLASFLGLHVRAARPATVARGWASLVAFGAVTVGWRVPVAVDALARSAAWFPLEVVTVLAGVGWLYAALAGSPPVLPLVQPPRRIVLCAFALWSVWIFAYIVGFSPHPFYPAYAHGATPVGAQQWMVGILWATSAAALVPVAFTGLMRWLAAERVLAAADAVTLHARFRAGVSRTQHDAGEG